LNAARETDDEGLGVELLADLRNLFDEEHDRLSSAEIVAALIARDDRPWSELGKARKPLTKAGLARLLRPFLIVPRTIRLPDDKTPKGYVLDDLKDAFLRYLPNAPLSNLHTATTQRPVGQTNDLETPQPDPCGGSETARSSHAERACGGVAVESPRGSGADHESSTDEDGDRF
jgi:hypothetical protein